MHPISQNSISIANVLDFTTKQNTVLQLNYRKRPKDKTNSKTCTMVVTKRKLSRRSNSGSIWNKMVDSTVGFDILGNTVPDTSLSINDRYGSKVRPKTELV